MLNKLRSDARGATIIEYALIASLIAVVAIAAMKAVGNSVQTKMNSISQELNSANANGGTT